MSCACGCATGSRAGLVTLVAVLIATGMVMAFGHAVIDPAPSADPTSKPPTPAPAQPGKNSDPKGEKTADQNQPSKAASKLTFIPADINDNDQLVLVYSMNRIDGQSQNLADYKGKVVLIVNTASECGLTPQYAALEKLYRENKDKGLVILGFPANNFMAQEPGTNKDIAEFCTSKYQVTFPMFEKIDVIGDSAHPLYRQLTRLAAPHISAEEKAKLKPGSKPGEPSWNFTKYIVDRNGRIAARVGPKITPDDPEVVTLIDSLLASPAPDSKPESPITPTPKTDAPADPSAGTQVPAKSP
jgi:glutathione peroxidase